MCACSASKKLADEIAGRLDSGEKIIYVPLGVNACDADEVIYHLTEVGGCLLSREEAKRLFEIKPQSESISAVLSEIGCISCENRRFIILKTDNESCDFLNIKAVRLFGEKAFYGCSQEICNYNQGNGGKNMNQEEIQAIVRQVISGMNAVPGGKTAGEIPKTSRVAMLTELEKVEIKEYPIPEIGDDDILVKVEGCGICGTDAHEFKRDPFGLIPVVLGHEGTGEIVKMGKNVKKDSAGKPLNIGDKIVTCMIFRDNPDITMFDLNKQNVGGADVYGLLPDDDMHLNGWFADYLVVRGGSSVFNVSELDLDSRILIEPCAVLIHAVERAKTTGILRFNSRVVVQGCGPIGLICIAVLRTMGVENIVAVDGEEKRLEFAKEMGAGKTVNFKDYKGVEALSGAVESAFGGYLADFAFQCTGSPVAHSNIYKFIRNGGGLCELGFFINGGDATINPHFDICSKEITTVGSWVYTLRDYATTFDFLKRANAIGLPMKKLITHKYPLSEINEAYRTNLKMEGLKIAIINE